MTISSALGLLAALIGTTATLLAAWGYIRNQHPPKQELFRGTLTIIIIMVAILGMAVLISRATTISVNGQQTIPVPPISIPGFPAPRGTTPSSPTTPASTTTPSSPTTPASTTTPSSTTTPASTTTPSSTTTPTPATSPIPSPSPTAAPSPTAPSLTPAPTQSTGR